MVHNGLFSLFMFNEETQCVYKEIDIQNHHRHFPMVLFGAHNSDKRLALGGKYSDSSRSL